MIEALVLALVLRRFLHDQTEKLPGIRSGGLVCKAHALLHLVLQCLGVQGGHQALALLPLPISILEALLEAVVGHDPVERLEIVQHTGFNVRLGEVEPQLLLE